MAGDGYRFFRQQVCSQQNRGYHTATQAFNGRRGRSTSRNGRLSQEIRPELQLNPSSYLGPLSRPTLPQQEGQTRKDTLGSSPNRSDGNTGQPPHIPSHPRATRLEQTVPATHGRQRNRSGSSPHSNPGNG